MECSYLGAENEDGTWECMLRGKCCLLGPKPPGVTCEECSSQTTPNEKDFLAKWKDPLTVVDRHRVMATPILRNMLAGGSAFLIGGGPSANDLPIEDLNRKGVWSLAVNNVAAHHRFRPQAFVCSDPPMKFSHSIWWDPAIMKFIPSVKLEGRRGRIRYKENGVFRRSKDHASRCPNVWGFNRVSWLWPDDRFFLGNGACWGNHQAGTEKTGQPKTVCTMLLGLRLLYFLGARTIFLVGVDFQMRQGYGYSFNQDRDAGAVSSNNAQFAVVNRWLCEMRQNGTFDRFGLKIYNCFQFSGLRAFPFVPFNEAIRVAKGCVEDKPDLSMWYQK